MYAYEYSRQVTTESQRQSYQVRDLQRHNWDDISETQRANIINAAYDDGMTDEEKAAVDAAILLDCATKREANRRLKPKQRKR